MKKNITIFLLIAIFVKVYAESDSICYMQSLKGTCIETQEDDTVFVDNKTLLFGSQVAFCPEMWEGIQGKEENLYSMWLPSLMVNPRELRVSCEWQFGKKGL